MPITCRVLLVDDDADWADHCQRELASGTVLVDVCYDVSKALDAIKDSSYDILFCDVKMSFEGEDDAGFRVLRHAKQFLPQARVVMVTAYDSSDAAVKSLRDEKSYYYLPKGDPHVDIISMNQLVEKMMDERRKTPVPPNPFNAQLGSCPAYIIVDRKNSSKPEMDYFISCLEEAEQGKLTRFLLTGETGTGKTCILKHLRKYLSKDENYRCSYYRIPDNIGSSSPDEFVANILLGIADGFQKTKRQDFRKLLDSLNKVGLKVGGWGIEGNVEMRTEKATLRSADLFKRGIQSLLTDLEMERVKAIAFLLDDLQNLSNCEGALNDLADVFSDVELESSRIVLGASQKTGGFQDSDIRDPINSKIRRFFAGKIESLGNLSYDELLDMVAQAKYDTGVVFGEPVLKLVYDYTWGQPYQTQVLLYHLYENQQTGIVTEEFFEKASTEARDDILACFPERYGLINPAERMIVSLIAESDEGATTRELMHGLIDLDKAEFVPNVENVCKALGNRGIVGYTADGRYILRDAMLRKMLGVTE